MKQKNFIEQTYPLQPTHVDISYDRKGCGDL